MNYKHYYKTDKTIGAGDIVFRHFTATPPVIGGKSRFVQFLEGTLTELIPDDFGDITVIPDYFLQTVNLYAELYLEKITFPDSVTTFGTAGNGMMCFKLTKDLTIVFPRNVAEFKSPVAATISVANDAQITYDFSKAVQVPKIASCVEGSFTGVKEIRVPKALYSEWITAWSKIAKTENYVAV